jgi:hypothetical protein
MGFKKLSALAVAGNVVTDFTVPNNTAYRVLYGHIALTTNATVADRRVRIAVVDDDGTEIFDVHSGAVVPASQTSQHHEIMQGIYRETAFIGGAIQVPIGSDIWAPTSYKLRIGVTNGVAGDSYTAYVMVEDR